jgi:hypothetical protein
MEACKPMNTPLKIRIILKKTNLLDLKKIEKISTIFHTNPMLEI